MHERVTRTSASVGSRIRGSGTSSTRTSPAAYMTVARIARTLAREARRPRPGGSRSRRRGKTWVHRPLHREALRVPGNGLPDRGFPDRADARVLTQVHGGSTQPCETGSRPDPDV